MPTTVFDPSEGPSDEQKAAEASALEQGEKIAQMEQEDRERKFQQQDLENENPDLIAGKFKSQDELLKAYEELQKKMKKSGLELKTRLNISSADNYGDFYDSVVVDYKFDSENNQLIDISDHCECYLF